MTKTMISSKQRQRGFTMIEMIGVLAVIAILASIVAPKIFTAINDAKINSFAANIQAVQTATIGYYKDVGTLPANESALLTKPSGATGWNGPYLDKNFSSLFSSVSFTAVTLSSVAPSTTTDFDIAGTTGTYNAYASKSLIAQLTFTVVQAADAKSISGIIDGDSANTGNASSGKWYNMGRFLISTTTGTEPTGTTTGTYRAFLGAY